MTKYTNWRDFFKFSTDVLEEDYHYDKNYHVKAKTKSQDGTGEYTLKFQQGKPNADGESKNAFELKQKWHKCFMSVENKFKSCGKVSTDSKFDLGRFHDQMKGWSYHIEADLISGATLDKSCFSSSLSYKQDNLEGKLTCDHGREGIVNSEFTFKPQEDVDMIWGGEATFDYKKTNLTRYAVGFLGRVNEHFSYGIKTTGEEGKRFGNFNLYTLQRVNPYTDVATSIAYTLSDKNLTATAGFSTAHHGNTFKGKISSQGLLALSWIHQFGSGTTLTLSSAFDLGEKRILMNNPHPFGISLEGKF